jgi:hypothetical protein
MDFWTKLLRVGARCRVVLLLGVIVASKPAEAKDRAYQSYDDWYYWEGFC